MDRDLVEAARNGDREAFVDLIRARTDRLFAIAQRILRDIDRAEDALQDALVIAWRDLRALRDPDRFGAWLQRLLINVCIAQATRARSEVTPRERLPEDRCRRGRGGDRGRRRLLHAPGDVYAHGPGNRWSLRIIDVDGARLVIAVMDYALTPAGIQAQSQAILDSIKIST